jgi:hypothetical protein
MIKVLKGLLGMISCEHPAQPPTRLKRANNNGDFSAVEIEPSSVCCAAAMQARGSRYLLRGAPRLPLYGCTMPTTCACKLRKNADRRDSDRRMFRATETNRWFVGSDSRNGAGRRSADD